MLNKMRTHKKTVVIAFLLLCLSFGVTFALLKNQSNSLTNTFVPGSVETEIDEPDPKPSGNDIEKEPAIKNTGKSDALVRAKVTLSPSELVEKLNIKINLDDSSDWILANDGYYYYSKILHPNETTTPLFTKVTGSGIVEGDQFSDKIAGLEIAIYHESVQNLVRDDEDKAIIAEAGYDENAKKIWSIFDSLNK